MPVMGYSGRLDPLVGCDGEQFASTPLSSGGAMGSRGRSIRLRIYSLVAIPLIAMVGLLAYVAGTSINNAINLDRAPNLIHATSLPTAEFSRLVQDERAAAVVYLFQPTAANLAAYDAATKATATDQPAFLAAMSSPGTKSSE